MDVFFAIMKFLIFILLVVEIVRLFIQGNILFGIIFTFGIVMWISCVIYYYIKDHM